MERYNPWWFGEPDPHIQEWSENEVRWVPDELELLSLKPFSLNFLLGPRQVGKTTGIKLLIQKLLKETDPKAVFYFSCDEVSDYKELGEMLDSYLSAKREWGVKRSYIFLDEAGFVDEWWRSVKARIDAGMFRNDVITVSGSMSIELLSQAELFPGRRGEGTDVLMMPLSFSKFSEVMGKAAPIRATSLNGVLKMMEANRHLISRLRRLFGAYLRTGGFPISILEYAKTGAVRKSVSDYLNWLKADWWRVRRSDSYMKEVISYIISARLSPISWYSLAQATSIGSPHTAEAYVETLENLLVAKRLNLISPEGRVIYRKNKKVHFTDPLIYTAFSEFSRTELVEEQVVESVVASHLARMFEVYYWRNGTEVDMIALVEGRQIGFEVKWGKRGWRKPRHLKEAYLLDRDKVILFLASLDVLRGSEVRAGI